MRFLGNVVQFWVIVLALTAAGVFLPSVVLEYYTWIAQVFFCFSASLWILELVQDYLFVAKVDAANKAVLITGCDTGFGHAMAKILDNRGYKVFAGCLDKASDGACELKETCSENVKVIQLDVTKDESVERAVKAVEQDLDKSELWAVVNNAGVLKGFHTELSRMKDYEMCIQVNALGTVRVTKAFLPLLRKSRGRVVNICSIAGRVRTAYMGPYMMSKSAAVAFSEVLCQEMRDFGIRVISIEPEFFGTQMCSADYVSNFLEEACSEVDEEIKSAYGAKYIEASKKIYFSIFTRSSPDVARVLDAIEAAVSLQNPADVYKPARKLILKVLIMVSERIPKVFNEVVYMVLFWLMGRRTPNAGLSLITRFFKM